MADVLRSALLQGRYAPGAELSDVRLAAEFGVSRGPVREGLLQLAAEGLLVHRHNRGFAVLQFERKDLEQIANIRRPLEILALEAARENATPATIARLRGLVDPLVEAFRTDGARSCARFDYEFHQTVLVMAGNPWLEAALERILLPYFVYVAAFGLSRDDQSETLMREMHERYIRFIAGDGVETAAACVDFHLGLTESSLVAG